jgi:hypothetical protein
MCVDLLHRVRINQRTKFGPFHKTVDDPQAVDAPGEFFRDHAELYSREASRVRLAV